MTNQQNGHVPLIGQQKIRGGVEFVTVMIRQLDEDGTYEPQAVIAGPNGQAVAVAGRENLVTAEDLVAMIREMVREELASALDKPS